MSYEDAGTRQGKPQSAAQPHGLRVEERRALSLSGVEDVESFDEREIVLRCAGSVLVVGGESLSVSRLSVESGDVTVQGRIDSLIYEDALPRRGGLRRRLGLG